MLNKKDFIKQTEKAIQEYSENNIEEQSLLKALSNYDLYQKQFNTFFEYLKDWYNLHNSKKYDDLKKDNYKFVKYLAEAEIKELEDEIYLSKGLEKEDLLQIKNLAVTLIAIYSNSSKIENFLTKKVKLMYPNLVNILGPILTVRFLNQAHSLVRLAFLPSSTLQLFGAETAMFKHLKFGKDCPKYGLLYLHPLMAGLTANQKGKLARVMANKIALASKYDLLKKPLHEELLEDVEKKQKDLLKEKPLKRR